MTYLEYNALPGLRAAVMGIVFAVMVWGAVK
jgi:hypothetical protein